MGWTETVMKALFGGEEGGGYLRLWSKNTSFGASSSTPVLPHLLGRPSAMRSKEFDLAFLERQVSAASRLRHY
jgi:hypothetical protein